MYHHFEYPEKSLGSIREALKPTGHLVIVDFERVKGVSPEFTINHLRAGVALIDAGVFAQAPSVDSDDIGGVVRGPSGPE